MNWCPKILLLLALAIPLPAQSPDSAGIKTPTSKAPGSSSSSNASSDAGTPTSTLAGNKGQKNGGGSGDFLGKDLPLFNPGSEVLTWDGKSWNILNNRIFRARFEKFLNAAPATTKEDIEYSKLIDKIMDSVSPQRRVDIDKAFSLLPRASSFDQDGNMCDTLASGVYSVWLSQSNDARIAQANQAMEIEAENVRWSAQLKSRGSNLDMPPENKLLAKEWAKERAMERDLRVGGYLKRLAEIEVMRKANDVKRAASELQVKIEFQTIVFQFFIQRRFQHVLMGNRFYRSLFGDGDTKLHLNKDTKQLLTLNSGLPATLGLLDTLANEAMRDVEEGVDAYKYQLSKGELDGATRRLQETFVVGEYVPVVRLLSREDKRKSLLFFRKQNELLTALSTKDYDRAQELVDELKGMANDWDSSVAESKIKASKQAAKLLLAKAKLAAIRGDTEAFEQAMAQAMEAWPLNPDITSVSDTVFAQADTKQQAMNDFDRLVSQKNFRQIFENRAKYIVATAMMPDKQQQLREILGKMSEVETAIIRANEISKRGDYAGGWEAIERIAKDYPNDVKLNRLHKDLTSKAANFVQSLNTAKQHEEDGQYGSSLAWYLKAQQIYPNSELAREGLDRVARQILPDEEVETTTDEFEVTSTEL